MSTRSQNPYTPDEIRASAQHWFRTAYQAPLRTHITHLVADYGTLTGDQLHRLCARRHTVTQNFVGFERTLAHLCRADILMIAPDVSRELVEDGVQPRSLWGPTRNRRTQRIARKTDNRLRAYLLGAVGHPLARLLLEREPGHLNYSGSRLHDILCAEAMLRLCEMDSELEPLAPGAVAVWEAESQQFAFRPDGLLIRRVDGEVTGGLLVEFCNEPWTSPERARTKLTRYASLAQQHHWLAWGLSWMPDLLIIYRAASTVKAFRASAPEVLGVGGGIKVVALSDVLKNAEVTLTPLE